MGGGGGGVDRCLRPCCLLSLLSEFQSQMHQVVTAKVVLQPPSHRHSWAGRGSFMGGGGGGTYPPLEIANVLLQLLPILYSLQSP